MRFAAGRSQALTNIRKQKENEKGREQLYHDKNTLDEIKVDFKPKTYTDKNKEIKKEVTHNLRNKRNYDFKPLIIKKFPYVFWIFGLIIFTLDILIIINILHSERLFKQLDGSSFWHYLLVAFGFILSISLFVAPKYEKVTLDKTLNSLIISKYYAFCCRVQVIEIKISDIDNIYPVQVVQQSNSINSTLYKIGIIYQNNKSYFIGKSLFKFGMIGDVKKMRFYVFGKYETFEDVENILVRSEYEMV